MTIGFDPNVLLSWYQARANQAMAGFGASAGGGGSAALARIPSAPWGLGVPQPKPNALVTAAVTGRPFINEQAAKIDAPNADADYKKLFAIYSGLQTLQALTAAAGDPKTPSFQLPSIQAAFQRGISELNSYIGRAKFDEFRLNTGLVTASETTSAAVPSPDPITGKLAPADTYTTAQIAADSADTAVAAFNGVVQFDAAMKTPAGAAVSVHFDLAQMGTTTRSMNAVAAYMNSQFKAAGVGTRVSVTTTTTTAQTVTVGGVTTTVTPAQNQYAFTLSGLSAQPVTFSAATTQPAVYVSSTAGNPALPAPPGSTSATTPATTNDTQQQLLKLEGGGGADAARRPNDSNYVSSQIFSKKLPAGVSAITSTVTGSDGSLYALGNATGAVNGQALKGGQDAVLLKYDAAGNLVYTRTLGAATTASGLSLAVNAQGQVAIAGSVTGDLNVGDAGINAATSDSFVTLYDAQGAELWSQRLGGSAANRATAVAFDASGNIYVGGQTQGVVAGAASAGGWDGYVRAYSATGQVLATKQFGSSGDDSVSGLVVNGTQLLVAGQDGVNGMVRSFDITKPSAMTAIASRNLGSLGGGSIAGIGLDATGNLLIGGGAGANLNVGNTTLARAGGMDAFGVQISSDLTSTLKDAVAYWGGSGSDKVTAATVAGGQVWVAGTSQTALPSMTPIGVQDGFVAALNVAGGAATYAKRFTSTDQMVAPESIAVDTSGGSALDRLGLPKGTISSDTSPLITSATSARAGDSFQIQAGAYPAKTITIDANETLQTLTQKILGAGFYNINVQQVTTSNGVKLTLSPNTNSETFSLIAGPSGHDALTSLGLQPGLIRATVVDKVKGVLPADKGKQTYGLRLPSSLDLNSPADIKAASDALSNAISATQSIYADLRNAAKPFDPTRGASGTVPTYLTNQIANYQAALARLTAGSDSSSGGAASLVSLFG